MPLDQQNYSLDKFVEVDIKQESEFNVKEEHREEQGNNSVCNNLTEVNIKEEPAECILTQCDTFDPLSEEFDSSYVNSLKVNTEAKKVDGATATELADVAFKDAAHLITNQEDHILQFFLNIAEIVKCFPVNVQNNVQSEVLQMITKAKKSLTINGM